MLKQRSFLTKTYVFMQEEQQGYKVFVEQAAHEIHKGAYDRALGYLNKAIRVSFDCLFFLVFSHFSRLLPSRPT